MKGRPVLLKNTWLGGWVALNKIWNSGAIPIISESLLVESITVNLDYYTKKYFAVNGKMFRL